MSHDVDRVIAELQRLGALRAARRIAARYGLALERVVERADKRANTARARREMIATITWTLGLSEHEAAEIFGCDHSTVRYHCVARERELSASLGRSAA